MKKKKPTKPLSTSSSDDGIKAILKREHPGETRALFAFDSSSTDAEVRFKFNLWARYFFPGYFMDVTKTRVIADSPSHQLIDNNNIAVYRGSERVFIDIGYRGLAKTTRTKLFHGFVIGNDMEHYRRFVKVLAEDGKNSEQVVTDVYNMYVDRKVKHFYPEIFVRTPEKRVERKDNFETAQGVKVLASTVGVEQRGQLQDEFRPDLLWFDDFESRKTLRSLVVLEAIWHNMDEAVTGLSRNGGAIYTCNYISERGNVQRLIEKYRDRVINIPITGRTEFMQSDGMISAQHVDDGTIDWPAAYTRADVQRILAEAEDAAGDYLGAPAAGSDVYFPREQIDRQEKRKPVREIGDLKIFHPYEPGHRYGVGADVAAGIGRDSSTAVVIDFTQLPARVVATYKSNSVKPEAFGEVLKDIGDRYGGCLIAPENNKYDAALARLKQIYDNIFVMYEKVTRAGEPPRVRQWGWNTNAMTKGTMFSATRKAVADGHLELSDPALIAEARTYTGNDLLDRAPDVRLTTRHFDLLTAAAIAWQMKDAAEATAGSEEYEQPAYEGSSEYEEGSAVSIGAAGGFRPRLITAEEQALPTIALEDDYQQPPYEGSSDFEHYDRE